MYRTNDYADLLEKNVIRINCGTIVDLYVNVKNVIYVRKIIFEILPHVVSKVENTYQVL